MRIDPVRFAAMGLCLVLSGSACVVRTHACTEIGCTDQTAITIQKAGGARPALALSLEIDGRTVECAAPIGNDSTSCDTQVLVTSHELQACVEESVGSAKILRCSGTGRFEQIVEIGGTPTTIRVTARDGATVLAERTFQPQYTAVQPNGPDCEPTCRQWGAVWNLP